MTASPTRPWILAPVRVGDLVARVALRPGVRGHDDVDVPDGMLAEAIAARAVDGTGLTVILGSGSGHAAAVAVARGHAVVALDRYRPHVIATQRTLDAIDAPSTTAHRVHHAVLAQDIVADGTAALVAIRLPTDRIGALQLVAEAFRMLAPGGTCLLSGANDEGARPAARMLTQWFGEARLANQHSGCRLLTATRRDGGPVDPAVDRTWLDAAHMREIPVTLAGAPATLCTRPGVFSWEHLDEATAVLADVMATRAVIPAGASLLDIGCGAGALGVVASRVSGGVVHLVDADADAVRCATATCARNAVDRAHVVASDVADAMSDLTVDVVVMNPPFHLGKGTNLALPQAFIDAAYARLHAGGTVLLVANRTLPYEHLLTERFGAVRTMHDGRRFKVLAASKASTGGAAKRA